MKIGILGGSFNPIHDGHVQIAKLAIKKIGLDQVWLIPTSSNPFKSKFGVSYQERLRLANEKIKGDPKIKVKDYQDCSKSTYKMLKRIEAESKKSQIFFIIGADNLENLHKWDNFSKLIRNFKIAVFSRGDKFYNLRSLKSTSILKKYQQNLIFRIKNVNISSSKIRNSNK